MTDFRLAQLNIAQLLEPLESPRLADFVANLDRINALAESAPGFVWRLQTEDGDATAIRPFGEDTIVNLSVWESIEALHDYVYRSGHIEVMRRRRDWFEPMAKAHLVLWWVPAGHAPTEGEAKLRLALLRERGPTADAFTFKQPFPAPDRSEGPDRFDVACPAG